MKAILSKFSSSPKIPHLRFQFPMLTRRVQLCLSELNDVSSKSPALFVSLNGITENPDSATSLHDAIKFHSERKKIPTYVFLQDDINGLVYYIATASKNIFANPFCKMGDLTVPVKTYTNIHKLLKYFGIGYERLGTKDSELWTTISEPSEQERQFTKRWLQTIKSKLVSEISRERGLKPEHVEQFGNKLLHPKRALELKLIDKICTLDQFKELHFPNNKIKEYSFSQNERPLDFNKREIQVLSQMVEWMQVQKVVLMAMDDPINEHIRNFIEIVLARLSDPAKLEELDVLAGKLIHKFHADMESRYKLIV